MPTSIGPSDLPRRLSPLGIVALLLTVAGLPAQAASEGATVLRRKDAAECLQFGVRELESALAAAKGAAAAGPFKVAVESMEQPALWPQRSQHEAAVPAAAEAFAIRRLGNGILVLGRDAVGAMYGALGLAEIVRQGGTLSEVTNSEQQPYLAIRAVNQFLFEEAWDGR